MKPLDPSTLATLVPAAFGLPFHGGFFGGVIRSHNETKLYGVAWAPKAQGERSGILLPRNVNKLVAPSMHHSMDNTVALAEAGSELAKWALCLEINGVHGWCLPARDVLELGYRHLKPTTWTNAVSFRDGDNPSSFPVGYPYTEDFPVQTTVEAFREGGEEAFEEDWYVSSSQYDSGSVWSQSFYLGTQDRYGKSASFRARACRLILLNP
jgi:hypothetical protein